MDSENSAMDPELWGCLQQHFDLENVYLKLPLWESYQLRGVCKNWNRLASERRCFTDPILCWCMKMYTSFAIVLFMAFWHSRHISSGCWRWRELPTFYYLEHDKLPHFKADCFEGVSFLYYGYGGSFMVFDTRDKGEISCVILPQALSITAGHTRALGMAVDTSVMPHTFKFIIGSHDVGTQIYDSATNSWETRSSLLVPCKTPSFRTCLHCGDHGDHSVQSSDHAVGKGEGFLYYL